MNFLRKILFPFAVLYGFITSVRNFLFDKGILKSVAFDVPVIAVGNLSVGGTGKTPQIEYIIRLLSDSYKIATLSRGYKRKSEGFVLANATSNAEILGDEPFQFYHKFPQIQVTVDANRVNGITQLLLQQNKPDVILLDDAFQHRKVKAGFYILLTAYNDLFVDDFILPTGNLRESRSGVKRADMIVVTKCPATISEIEQEEIRKKIGVAKHIFFTCIEYDDCIYSENEMLKVSEVKSVDKLLLAGIAKPKPFFDYLKNENDVVLQFSDHHDFSDKELVEIKEKAKSKIIITTEKDFVRLKGKLPAAQLFYLPIKSSFIDDKTDFDKTIINYVESSTGNG